jgi:hypothetical protein
LKTSTNNFTLTGSLVDGDNTYEYIGKIEFNSDKVLQHVHDEMVQKNLGDTVRIERYIWDLTYTAGTGSLLNGTNSRISCLANNFYVDNRYDDYNLEEKVNQMNFLFSNSLIKKLATISA